MIIGVGFLAGLVVYLLNRGASRRAIRVGKADLDVYGSKSRREGTYPFDYLGR